MEKTENEQKHLHAININDMDLTMCYTNGGKSPPPHIWQLENKTTEGKCIHRSGDMEDSSPEGRAKSEKEGKLYLLRGRGLRKI
jgi:hypothetical protein